MADVFSVLVKRGGNASNQVTANLTLVINLTQMCSKGNSSKKIKSWDAEVIKFLAEQVQHDKRHHMCLPKNALSLYKLTERYLSRD